MRFGQAASNQSADYQKILDQLSEGQHRLAYLEDQMHWYKKLMIIMTIITGVVIYLNRSAKK